MRVSPDLSTWPKTSVVVVLIDTTVVLSETNNNDYNDGISITSVILPVVVDFVLTGQEQ